MLHPRATSQHEIIHVARAYSEDPKQGTVSEWKSFVICKLDILDGTLVHNHTQSTPHDCDDKYAEYKTVT